MKEWPILFQDRLVRANLADRKTETRRVGPAAKRWLKAEAGDVLWVREAWHPVSTGGFHFRADGPCGCFGPSKTGDPRWRPSIHMPRAACRLFLELLEKPWLERLQDITEEGARAEGVEGQASVILPGLEEYRGAAWGHLTARGAFASLWDGINEPRGYGWDRNPEVTVLRYRRLP